MKSIEDQLARAMESPEDLYVASIVTYSLISLDTEYQVSAIHDDDRISFRNSLHAFDSDFEEGFVEAARLLLEIEIHAESELIAVTNDQVVGEIQQYVADDIESRRLTPLKSVVEDSSQLQMFKEFFQKTIYCSTYCSCFIELLQNQKYESNQVLELLNYLPGYIKSYLDKTIRFGGSFGIDESEIDRFRLDLNVVEAKQDWHGYRKYAKSILCPK